MHGILLAVLLTAGATTPSTSWYENYERGVRLIQDGQAAAAIPLLEAALAEKSSEALQTPTRLQQYTDYTPHLYLAIAYQNSGNLEKARRHLEQAENSGVAAKSEVGRPLLIAYQLLLRGDALRGPRPAYATYSDKAPVLSEAEFNVLRNDVLSRCDLPANTNLRNAPWYANYELGLELERKGDYPRALTHFIDAVSARPNPQKQARMYGMWLVDYYPYFHIARSHARLENWECAKNALEISERLREIPASGAEMNELLSLRRAAEEKLTAKN